MSAETGSETRSGIGARLRAARERMGMTLLQAAEKLHVDAKVIESLEAERFDALGAMVFVRGHLKHYAELIGEQPAALLDMYAAATKPALPDLTRLPKAPTMARPSKLAVPALVVLIGFALIGIVWWVLQTLHGPAGSTRSAQPSTVSVVPDNLPGSDSDATAGSRANGSPAATTPAPTAPAAVAPAASGQTTANGTAGAEANKPVRGKAIDVTLRFAADSWVEVYDANGEKLFYDIGSAESSRKLSGVPPLRVVLGNAPGVSLDINGKPAAVPADTVSNDEAKFTINRSGRIVRARSPGDGD